MNTLLENKISGFLPHLGIAVIIFIIFALVGFIASRVIIKITKNSEPNSRQIFLLLAKICYVTMIILGIITALGNVGINIGAVVAGLGLTGFGVGFALKDAISNVLAGILTLIYRPFKISDYVEIGSFSGEVLNIDLRYITLQTPEKKILIPNANLFNTAVTVITNPKEKENE